MKRLTRAAATAAAAVLLSVGVVSLSAPAQAFSDSSWGWAKTPATPR